MLIPDYSAYKIWENDMKAMDRRTALAEREADWLARSEKRASKARLLPALISLGLSFSSRKKR